MSEGNRKRIVRVGTKAQKALWKYLTIHRTAQGEALFLDRSGQPLTPRAVKIMVKRLGIQAGIRVHPHQLRHTFAINFLRAGGDVFSLRYLLGHSSLAMTERYLQSLNAEDAARAHQRFSPLDNLATKH
jgi:site-specific recombinase XerD